MKIYRSMCEEEFKRTIELKKLDFAKSRFKWFTPSREYQARVRDGNFNNSSFVPERYVHLIEFEIEDSKSKWFTKMSTRELMLDRRVANQVPIISMMIL